MMLMKMMMMRRMMMMLQDYWQTKLEDERGFYEHQLRQNEQQFNQLETRMKGRDTTIMLFSNPSFYSFQLPAPPPLPLLVMKQKCMDINKYYYE